MQVNGAFCRTMQEGMFSYGANSDLPKANGSRDGLREQEKENVFRRLFGCNRTMRVCVEARYNISTSALGGLNGATALE